ncbi:NAD-dependent epimerase/dehydratase family protein [Aquipuribacter sp. SD81]|uniref:NAD-dependent epimerase/dehydratase family protein n=1 Tax=Aquipuribacter sp. SD81 TaxID=3127703 RepID=UPI003016307E
MTTPAPFPSPHLSPRPAGARHVVVGAGTVGTAVARLLAGRGDRVTVVTRSGTGPEHPAVERVALDAGDAAALADVVAGSGHPDDRAVAVHNCVNPAYHRWSTDWPPVAASLLGAAEAVGAVLATVSNLYPYGPVDVPMTPDLPVGATDSKGLVRARMWAGAKAAHDAGRVRVVEVRASDYLDAHDQSAVHRLLPDLLRGRTLRVIGDPDQPHSWTTTGDTARTLVAVADDPGTHGRVWHVPSNPPRTQREVLADLAAAAGVPLPRVVGTGPTALRVAGWFSPVLRELRGTLYQFTAPFVLDDRATRDALGLTPEPSDAAVARMVAAARVPATSTDEVAA